ncbi:MAG TPA: hypothetical protein PKB13_07410 [Clostridia bacterium]|jgi:hypothetical protein|nr:hypothetical protein [Clostridia bacterium]
MGFGVAVLLFALMLACTIACIVLKKKTQNKAFLSLSIVFGALSVLWAFYAAATLLLVGGVK